MMNSSTGTGMLFRNRTSDIDVEITMKATSEDDCMLGASLAVQFAAQH